MGRKTRPAAGVAVPESLREQPLALRSVPVSGFFQRFPDKNGLLGKFCMVISIGNKKEHVIFIDKLNGNFSRRRISAASGPVSPRALVIIVTFPGSMAATPPFPISSSVRTGRPSIF